MMAKNSGKTTSRAPCSAAFAMRRRASLRLPITFGPDAIWMAATLNALACAAMSFCVEFTHAMMLSLTGLFVWNWCLYRFGHHGFAPGSADIVFKRHQLIEWAAQYLADYQGADSDRGACGKSADQRYAVAKRRKNLDAQILGSAVQVDTAFHRDLGGRTVDMQILRVDHAVLDCRIAIDIVELKAFAEHIGKVQRDAAGQGLQAEYAEQFSGARIHLEESAFAGIQLQCSVQRSIVEFIRRAVPCQAGRQLPAAIPDSIGITGTCQYIARIAELQLQVYPRLRSVLRRMPDSIPREAAVGIGDVQTAQLPVIAIGMSNQFKAPELPVFDLQVFNHDLQCGQLARAQLCRLCAYRRRRGLVGFNRL